jgi:hypothetical protein
MKRYWARPVQVASPQMNSEQNAFSCVIVKSSATTALVFFSSGKVEL